MEKLSTGVDFLNDFLDGGYEREIVTTIYGPAGSGKTLLLLLAMRAAPEDGKIIFVDTEGGFSGERFAQVCPNHREVLERTIFLNPTTFDEQEDAVEELESLVDSMNVSLVLFDTFTALYRINITQDDNYDLNKQLAKQLRTLVGISRDHELPVLTTTQVYTDIDTDENNLIGGTIVENMSKCLLEIQERDDHYVLRIDKHRSQPSGKEVEYRITQSGIERA